MSSRGARDEFPQTVKAILAGRVGYRCSDPDCRAPTSGPQVDETKILNVGIAAHITAASPLGPRYDPGLTSEERKGYGNGIWMCQTHGKLVDNDARRYSRELLLEWKVQAEYRSRTEIGKASNEGADGIRIWGLEQARAAVIAYERLFNETLRYDVRDLAEIPLLRNQSFATLTEFKAQIFAGSKYNARWPFR